MDNRKESNNLDAKGYQEVGFIETSAPIEFTPFPMAVDNEPTNERRSWSKDLQDLRNQFPFVQIDPPLVATTRFRMDQAASSSLTIIPPPNAQAYRITYFTNNSQVNLGLSGGDTANPNTNNATDSSQIYCPQPVWRYCRNTSNLTLFTIGPGANGVITGTIEWFCQL